MAVRKVPILPTLVTLANAFCGFAAISYVMQARMDPTLAATYMKWAGWLILLAIVFDALDGKVARLAKQTSEFGVQLDSLSDMISFGVAPAVMVKAIADMQNFLPRVAWVTAALFMMCAALRLARFNVDTDDDAESHNYFRGLPSPAAGGLIASLAALSFALHSDADFKGIAAALAPAMDGLLFSLPFLAAVLALLMISNVRYPHIASRLLRNQEPFDYLIRIILLVLFVLLTRPFSLPILFVVYVGMGVVLGIKELLFRRFSPPKGETEAG